MGSSWKIGRIAGIDVYLHWSLPLILLYIGWVSRNDISNFIPLTIGMILLFVCVALHEFGHSFAARFFGIPTKRIVLAVVGGVAMFERGVEKPSQQVVVFAAGPLVNLVLAGVFGVAKMLLVMFQGYDPFSNFGPANGIGALADTVLGFLTLGNLILAIFNLLPILPLDGGHILRSFCCWIFGIVWGARISSTISMVVLTFYLLLTITQDTILFLMGAFFLTTNLAVIPGFSKLTTRIFNPTRYALIYGPQTKAKENYDQQLAAIPDNMNARLHRALANFQVGQHQQSSQDADFLLPRDPHCYEAYRLRVMNTGAHNPIAYNYVERLRVLDHQNEHSAFILGTLAQYHQDPDLAFSYFQQALKFNAHATNSDLFSLMMVLEGSKFNPQAVEHAAQRLALSIKHNPYELDLYYYQALVALYQQNWALAQRACQTIVGLDSSYVYAYELLGRIAWNQGNALLAEQYFNRAIPLYNGYSSLLLRGLVRHQLGRANEAYADWEAFLQGLRRAEATFTRISWMQFEPSTLSFFEYAMPRYGHEAFLLEAYADELLRVNAPTQALESYLRAQQEYLFSEHLYLKLGLCYHTLGRYAEAEQQFELAAQQERNTTHQRWAKQALQTYRAKEVHNASSTEDSPEQPSEPQSETTA
jgi:Zn-dependent protease/tetratricopeptide (TPR) repeat protein